MKHHTIKCETDYYQAVESKDKLFEVRKNDRSYACYDMITLREVVKGIETGRELGPFEVTYILRGPAFGIEDGYCVMNIKQGWEE